MIFSTNELGRERSAKGVKGVYDYIIFRCHFLQLGTLDLSSGLKMSVGNDISEKNKDISFTLTHGGISLATDRHTEVKLTEMWSISSTNIEYHV